MPPGTLLTAVCSGALALSDALPGLQRQHDDLTSQFHGFSSPATTSTLTHPNDPSLVSDFDHATSTSPPPATAGPASGPRPKNPRSASKTVRFSDSPATLPAPADPSDLEARLFAGGSGDRYRDNPDDGGGGGEGAGYRDAVAADGMDNTQIHAYHARILSQQDEQLDALGASIARQRELSMHIGDELEDQVAMLDDTDTVVDRHQTRLDRARNQVGRLARTAGESKQMVTIIILILILVLLIAVLK